MVYRIRYRRDGTAGEAETIVEANNTAEALVKFRHAHAVREGAVSPREQVTSISAEFHGDELPWPA